VDRLVVVNFLRNYAARFRRQEALTGKELAVRIATASAQTKEQLEWLFPGRLGDVRSRKGSLRHTGNVIAYTAIPIEHDEEKISFDEAVEIAEKHGFEAVFYTSPRHRRDGHGDRWRGLVFLGQECPPEELEKYLNRLAGIYRYGNATALAAECWSISQAYYFGAVDHNPEHQAVHIDGLRFDHWSFDELDKTALGKPATKSTGLGDPGGPADEDVLIERMTSGADFHPSQMRLIGLFVRRGVSREEIKRRLYEIFDGVAEAQRDERWQKRRADVPRSVDDICDKDQGQREEAEAALDALLAKKAAAAPPGGNEEEDEIPPPPASVQRPWPAIGVAAYHGLAGKVVALFMPHTEADPVAILIHFLTEIGNAIGRHGYYIVEGDRHYTNLFALIIGATSKARKGTAAGRSRQILEIIDPAWANKCVHGGVSTGEGLIWHVRDEIKELVWRGSGANRTQVLEVTDPGIEDKRLLIIEAEFARTIAVMERPGNTLSAVLRAAWDKGRLEILTKTSAAHATDAHISAIGHITLKEIQGRLTATEQANGFANRFLFALVRRSQLLPFGGNLDPAALSDMAQEVAQAVTFATGLHRLEFDGAARLRWGEIYEELSNEKPGLAGDVIARGEAQVIRLAVLYAVLDSSPWITVPHLEAALELWRFCEESAVYVFGDSTGDPMADEILRILREVAPGGLTQNEIRNLFTHHHSAMRIGAALGILLQHHKVRHQKRVTNGRPATVWYAR
jgi:hypothetical protein